MQRNDERPCGIGVGAATIVVLMSITQGELGPEPPCGGPVDWPAVLATHERWLRRVVYRRVGELQAVEDVMAEVSLATVRCNGSLHDASKAPAWLYRVAVRQSLMYRRRCGRQRKLTERYVQRIVRPAAGDGERCDPLRWLLDNERSRLVRDAIDRLPRRDADVLMFKYVEQLSYRQIADRVGLTERAVESRLHRARERLRGLLARHEHNEVKP